jgi:CubicO group peptidase (beta-lactamase class C family)
VELRAGVPFEQRVEERVFGPLGMAQSTFAQSDAHPLQVGAACNYRPDGAGNVPVQPSYDFVFPSGSAIAPAADMGRFMLAELQGDRRLLDDGTLRSMQDQQFVVDPRLPR